MPPTLAPYGSWLSPIKAEMLASAGVRLAELHSNGADLFWLEGRPLEKGRGVVVRRAPDGSFHDLTPPEFNARTTVHEYGGGVYFADGQTLFFSNFADQRIYAVAVGAETNSGDRIIPDPPLQMQPRPITPAPETEWGLRYADGRVIPVGAGLLDDGSQLSNQLDPPLQQLVFVRQYHPTGKATEAVNEIVILPADGSRPPRAIISGRDFYSDPRPSPDGRRLAWLCWDHPNMPWDASELWLADFQPDGKLANARRVAGGASESIALPRWSPGGALYFVSDRSGWFNLYRLRGEETEPLLPMNAEFAEPQWVFNSERYTFLPDGRIAAIYAQHGSDHLGLLHPDGRFETVETGLTIMDYPVWHAGRLFVVGAGPAQPQGIQAITLESGAIETIRSGTTQDVDPGFISIPQPIEFPTEGGLSAHALYYPPANRDFTAPPGEMPPLLVLSHGGPTSAASPMFNLSTLYWTSRGFGVVDVNYGGSSGYGRAYRQRLDGAWGVVDVQDCINAARYLIAQGKGDPRRVAVRGGSAGGYTTLCALTMYDFFTAGASHFGVADLEPFAVDTHKFESRYLDRLIGPYPAAKALYRQRSPIHFVDRITCPMILFQGLEDKVVPPSQAEMMVHALAAKGLPYAYLAFEGEQHGFRKAETIRRVAEAELYFYSKVFSFELAEPVEAVDIRNL